MPRPARRTTMGVTSDSFQSIRFSSPQRLLEVDRLMEIAARVGAAGAHGGMTRIDFDWARATRKMKEELDMYVEIQTFLPREDPACLRARGQGRQGSGRDQPARRVPARPALRDVRIARGLADGGRRLPQADRTARADRREAQDAARHREPQGLARRSAGRAAEAVQQRVPRRQPRHRE